MKKFYLIIFLVIFVSSVFGQNYATFTQAGPVKFPANPSVQTTGMGRVSQLVYHPTDSNILFAVSASGGVFKTSNEGISWRPISDFLPQTSCASLVINPLKPDVMFLGTGDANYNGGGMGVWKTNDGGSSWNQTTTGLGNKLVSYIAYTPNDTNTLIAACSDGIYKSTNAGSSWVKKTTVNGSYRALNYRPASNNIIYSATDAYFYRSYDNGETWIQSTLNASIACAGIKIAVCPSDTSRLYCIVWKNGATSPFGGVYKSTNNGANFTLQSDTPNILGYSGNGTSMDGQGSYNLGIIADPTNADIIYLAGINVWKSTNQGLAFTLSSSWGYGVHADKHGFIFSPYNSNKLYIHHDGGLDRTIDGGATWTTFEDGLSASEFYRMGSSPLYNDYVIGGLQDNGLDVGTDKKFSTVRGGDWGGDFVFDAFDSSLLYENGGLKRNIISHTTSGINGQGGIYGIQPRDSNTLFEITTQVFRTKNLRANPSSNVAWSQISSMTGNTGPRCISYSKASAGTLYVAFNSQSFYRSDNANDASPSFTKLTSFPYNSGEQIRQIETYDFDSNIVYVLTTSSRILRSNDKGGSWVSINRNLPANTIIKFLLNQKVTDSSMYACTAFAVYYRNRFISNWVNFSQGLPTVAQISDMEIVSDATIKGRLHISTYGRGIWQTDLYKSAITLPVADFSVQSSSSQPCSNSIIVVDNSTCSPTSRKWQVSPATGWVYINGTDSFSSRAEIRFNTSGMYFISLTVFNNKGTDTKTVNYNYSTLSTPPGCITTTTNLGGYTIGVYRFEFNTINNGSGTGNTSYEDFSCSANTIVRAGATYTAWVTNGNAYNENAKIYIDYNGNGVFTDANELVGTITSGLGRRSCSVSILLNPPQLNKFLRMRVVSDYNTVNASCGTLNYGQSEDYAIWIDKTKPTVAINIPKPTVGNSFNAIFTTSEVVTGFDVSDISLSNATLSNFTQNDIYSYSARITPISNAMVVVGINVNGFSDLAGNTNNAFSDSTLFFLGIKTFTFTGISVKDTITQTLVGGSITCYVPFGTVLDSLIASFTNNDSANAYIGATTQTSTISKNNFKNTITYTIKSVDNSLNKTYTVNVVVNKNMECKLLTYGILSPLVNGNITHTAAGGTVDIALPFGSALLNLTSLFTVSDSAKAYIGSTLQNSGTSVNNFTTTVTYIIIAQDTNYKKTYAINISFGKSKSCDLLTYAFQSPAVTGTITPNATGGTVSLTVPFGTTLTAIKALFTISDSAKIYNGAVIQVSGVTSNNFSSTLTYKIIAQDTNYSKTYTVSVIVSANTESDLLTYDIVTPASTGIISTNANGGIVDITVPFATNISNLIGQFTISSQATAIINNFTQQPGVTANNFSDTVLLVVKSQDGLHSKFYKITVHITPNSQCDLLTYKFNTPNSIGVITPSFNGGSVALMVPFSTNLTNLVADFTTSDLASATVNSIVQVRNGSTNDFTNPVNYLIKAQNLINTKTYVVTVTRATGIDALERNGNWIVFPNPAQNLLNLENLQSTINDIDYNIIDVTGRVVLLGSFKEKKATIDISELAVGVYSIQIFTEQGTAKISFVKN